VNQPDPQVLAEAKQIAIKFKEVAWMLWGGQPPEWVVPLLRDQQRLVGYWRNPSDDDDKKLIKRATDLAKALSDYGKVEAEAEDLYGFPASDVVGAASIALDDLIEYLESQLRPPRRGGPTPDSRRRICAAVCGYVWQRQHREVQPYSLKLQEACEAYWQACGQQGTGDSAKGNVHKNWEEFLVRHTNDAEYVEYLDQLAERLTTR
jgi:hypothetical protein